jgi:hypothetical protein
MPKGCAWRATDEAADDFRLSNELNSTPTSVATTSVPNFRWRFATDVHFRACHKEDPLAGQIPAIKLS